VKTQRAALFGLGLLVAACSPSGETPALEAQAGAPERYVLIYNGDRVPARAEAAIEAAGGRLVNTLPQVGIAVAVSENPDFAGAAKGSGVQAVGIAPASALPDAAVNASVAPTPTAADTAYESGLLWGINRVKAPQAWATGVTGSHDTVVAVIDTGIATNHPDLAPNTVHTECFVSTSTETEKNCTPYPSASDHGTHVAGTVAAAFGGGSVVGVGPNLGLAGYNTFEVIPGCGVCTYSDTRWQAMLDAADRGFGVINMSLGSLQRKGGQGSSALNAFIRAENRVADYVLKAGTTIVASAGNSNVDLNGLYYNTPGGVPGIVNVGATGIRPQPRFPQPGAYDVRSFFSNYGAQVTLAAPGGDCGLADNCNAGTRPANYAEYLIFSSTVNLTQNPACVATESCPVGYGWKAGTNMAAPHVAGVAGLVIDSKPGLSARQVSATLQRTAENLGDRQSFGHGMVNAEQAVQ
jgi:lantibiotic leader peptide-processing serine protease